MAFQASAVTTGGRALQKFLKDAQKAARQNNALAIDVGWINTNEALTALRNELGTGRGPQANPRPALRNTAAQLPEIARPILKLTMPDTMRVTRLAADQIAKAGAKALRVEVTRLDVVATGKMRSEISSRVITDRGTGEGVNA